ncbi:uncharacterized protein LOC109948940 [Prunus persica]|uniref:uncharacterized protein LOC109948940 n=1 Tax=Prunus persica TaxID=3760 RepID=UPI0009AB2A79|nr:uncharacterized protein LOC109948940 [Prunus persica]
MFCCVRVQVGHCLIMGNEMKDSHMWRKNHGEFSRRSGSPLTEMTLASRWKILNKELEKWRDMLTKARYNIQSGKNLGNEIIQAQMWFGAIGQGTKSFNNHQCWEVVKNWPRFKIITIGPSVVLNEKPLHDSWASKLPFDSSIIQDSPIQMEWNPIRRKVARPRNGALRTMKMQNSWSKLVFKAQ